MYTPAKERQPTAIVSAQLSDSDNAVVDIPVRCIMSPPQSIGGGGRVEDLQDFEGTASSAVQPAMPGKSAPATRSALAVLQEQPTEATVRRHRPDAATFELQAPHTTDGSSGNVLRVKPLPTYATPTKSATAPREEQPGISSKKAETAVQRQGQQRQPEPVVAGEDKARESSAKPVPTSSGPSPLAPPRRTSGDRKESRRNVSVPWEEKLRSEAPKIVLGLQIETPRVIQVDSRDLTPARLRPSSIQEEAASSVVKETSIIAPLPEPGSPRISDRLPLAATTSKTWLAAPPSLLPPPSPRPPAPPLLASTRPPAPHKLPHAAATAPHAPSSHLSSRSQVPVVLPTHAAHRKLEPLGILASSLGAGSAFSSFLSSGSFGRNSIVQSSGEHALKSPRVLKTTLVDSRVILSDDSAVSAEATFRRVSSSSIKRDASPATSVVPVVIKHTPLYSSSGPVIKHTPLYSSSGPPSMLASGDIIGCGGSLPYSGCAQCYVR